LFFLGGIKDDIPIKACTRIQWYIYMYIYVGFAIAFII